MHFHKLTFGTITRVHMAQGTSLAVSDWYEHHKNSDFMVDLDHILPRLDLAAFKSTSNFPLALQIRTSRNPFHNAINLIAAQQTANALSIKNANVKFLPYEDDTLIVTGSDWQASDSQLEQRYRQVTHAIPIKSIPEPASVFIYRDVATLEEQLFQKLQPSQA